MISLLTVLVLLALFLLATTTFAATRSVSMLATCNAIMMVCSLLLGAAPIQIDVYTTAAGNIFYAVGMFGFCLNVFVYGAAEAHAAIRSNLVACVIVFGSIFALQHLHALDREFDAHIQLAGVRIVTFALMESLHIHLLGRRLSTPLHAIAVTLLMQTIDTMIYVPVAFLGLLPAGQILLYCIVGVIARFLVTLLSTPFLAALPRLKRNPLTNSQH